MGWCKLVYIGLVGSAALALAACGLADSHAPVPEFMRAHEPDKPSQSPPDVKQLVRDQLDSVFVSTSSPHEVRVSRPSPQPPGPSDRFNGRDMRRHDF